jgi:phenylalanyl-tRNA synthetase beta chain
MGALLMGTRRPAHFTEPAPPAFDAWDAKALAESAARAAFPGRTVRMVAVEGTPAWQVEVDGRGTVGMVQAVTLDRPAWATEAWGVELSLGVLSSEDVAPHGTHAHAPAEREGGATITVRVSPLPTTPAAEFDVALLVPDALAAATVEHAIVTAGGELLEQVQLFDEFRGAGIPAGMRSLAWRLTWRHPERTLRDKEIEGRRARLLELLEKDLGVRPRAT